MTTPYDGDLTIGKATAHAMRHVTVHRVQTPAGVSCAEVLLGPLDPPTWDTATEWGRGPDPDTAWRYALAALLPDTDPVTPSSTTSSVAPRAGERPAKPPTPKGTTMTTTTANLAESLAVDGINAATVRLPGRVNNMGEKARDYELLFHAPDADQSDDHDRANNALRVEVSHNKHRKCYEVEVRPLCVHRYGYSMRFDFRINDTITLATVPAARYSAKALDALAHEWLTKIAADGMPTNEHTADLWASIVAAHGVPAPAMA